MHKNIEHYSFRGTSSSSGRYYSNNYGSRYSSRSSYSNSSNRRYSSPKAYNQPIYEKVGRVQRTITLGGTGGAPFWGWNIYNTPNLLYPYFIIDPQPIEIIQIEEEIGKKNKK
jgi:hypothetical protein